MPNYTIELTEGEISTIIYYLEGVTKDKLDGEFPEEIQTIFSKLEGAVDTNHPEKYVAWIRAEKLKKNNTKESKKNNNDI